MLKHYFNTTVRILLRNKMYSVVNILGLTVGLTACLLVATVVLNNLSYDRQWSHSKDIFRIIGTNNMLHSQERYAQTFSGLGPELKRNFPEVQDYCRMQINKTIFGMGSAKDGVSLKCLSADTSLWRFLDFKVISGTPQKFVPGYTNIVISEAIAKEYFPHTNPVGRTVEDIPELGDKKTYLITGVIKDMSANSVLTAQTLELNEPYPGEDQLYKNEFGTFLTQYLLLKPGTDITAFTRKFNAWYESFTGKGKKVNFCYELQPIASIHLHPEIGNDTDTTGSIRNVYIFSGIAILLLLIACFNFVNLTAVRALTRVRETGIRKVLGAGKWQLITQFLFESLVFFLISFLLAVLLYSILLHPVELFTGHRLQLNLLQNTGLTAAAGMLLLIVSLFTGLYPAWILSRPKVATTLKGALTSSLSDTGFLRKCLITGQFIITVVLVIAMIVAQRQLYYLNHKELGYDENNLLKIGFNAWGNGGDAFKQGVLKLPGVENAAITRWVPSQGGGSMSAMISDPADTTQKLKAWYIAGDANLASTLRFTLMKGRLLDTHLPTDALNSDSLMRHGIEKLEAAMRSRPVLITAYTAKLLSIKKLNEPNRRIQGIPVGIVKDFNNESLREGLRPCIISADAHPLYGSMLIRVNPLNAKRILDSLHRLWQQFYPERALQYDWISGLLADQYKSEKTLEQLFTLFSSLSILLACLGLFGFITFTAEQRTKEIGIRKVLGASVIIIVSLLSKDFIKLVLIAILIASPIAWWTMNKWLQNFAYRIHLSWWIFAGAGALAILIALITVSFQAIRAAVANPVESLRTE